MVKKKQTPQTPDELAKKVDSYFNKDNKKITITGLILELGFKTKDVFYDYAKKGVTEKEVIDNARLRVERHYEEGLTGSKVAGCIFALKNMGWSDKNEINISGRKDIKIEIVSFDRKLLKKIDNKELIEKVEEAIDEREVETLMLNSIIPQIDNTDKVNSE